MYLINLFSSLLIIFSLSEVILTDVLPTCLPQDFKYSFTECDDSNGRWRVSVPKSSKACVGGAPNAATRVDKCFTSCESGYFFNSTTLNCEKCSPGFYSLGGGIKIEAFNSSSLPSGFRLTAQSINSSQTCVGWNVVSNSMESVANYSGGGCISKILYTVRIVKKGKLSFKYQYSVSDDMSNAIIFTFQYQNYDDSDNQDSSGSDSEMNMKLMPVTSDQKWKEFTINLQKPGLYVFIWRSVQIGRSKGFFPNTIGSRSVNWFAGQTGSHSGLSQIRLKSIFIDGVGYASECSPCEAGTYTNVSGSSTCSPCPPNTEFPGTGAIACSVCDSSTKYSPKGSEHCLEKPICGHNDYYSIESECDVRNEVQRISYKWIEPKICRGGDYLLPKPENRPCNQSTVDQKAITSCNLGQELRDDQKCYFCPENQYRDETTTKCQSCPPSTSPFYALSYKMWLSGRPNDQYLPEHMSTECIGSLNDDLDYNCDSKAWLSNTRDYIRTGSAAPLGSYLFLTLNIPGFRSKTGGVITFKFEVECNPGDKCLLMFVETKRNAMITQQTNVIKEWNEDSFGVQSFRYSVKQNVSIAFSWVFQRNQSFQSNAKIYEITVTNPTVGSAIKCNPCPHSNLAYCIPCPFGLYFESETNITKKDIESIRSRGWPSKLDQNCRQCQNNSIINSSLAFPIGAKNSCIPCGPGLIDHKGISCYSDCNLTIDGDRFDLSQLKQPLVYRGGNLFTGSGTYYFHLFNITLCGRPDFRAVCIDNMTTFDTTDPLNEEFGVRSMICRSTIVPDNEQPMAAQSVSLGDELIGITRSTTFQNITVHSEFQTTKSDLHFYYSTPVPTTACPNGRKLTLTVRCAPDLEQIHEISTPKECPDGTCDGCTFHLLVKTKTAAACRLCRTSDYETVVGECVEGFQQIHFVNPKGCIISVNGQTKVQRRHCSVIPRQVQIGIALVSAIGVILMVLVFHFWKKNRSLEYKYCKLIEGNDKSAECCAEDEDEDENDNEDQVMIHPKKPKEVYEEGYETIQLTKHNDRNTDII